MTTVSLLSLPYGANYASVPCLHAHALPHPTTVDYTRTFGFSSRQRSTLSFCLRCSCQHASPSLPIKTFSPVFFLKVVDFSSSICAVHQHSPPPFGILWALCERRLSKLEYHTCDFPISSCAFPFLPPLLPTNFGATSAIVLDSPRSYLDGMLKRTFFRCLIEYKNALQVVFFRKSCFSFFPLYHEASLASRKSWLKRTFKWRDHYSCRPPFPEKLDSFAQLTSFSPRTRRTIFPLSPPGRSCRFTWSLFIR